MANGRYNLIIEGVEYPLYFNMPAVEEFTKRQKENAAHNNMKIVVDMIYSGMVGYSASNRTQPPVYRDVYEAVDKWFDDDGFNAELKRVHDAFVLSKKKDQQSDSDIDKHEDDSDINEYWSNVRKYCLGYIGMSIDEYNNITYADLMRKIDGFNKRVKANISMQRHLTWTTYIAPHLDPKKMAKSIDDFWPLEEKREVKKIDDSKRERIRLYLQRKNEGK